MLNFVYSKLFRGLFILGAVITAACIPIATEKIYPPESSLILQQSVLKAHNDIRAKHCVKPLQWSEELQNIAVRNARAFVKAGCPKLAHTAKSTRIYKGRTAGENLIGAYSPDFELGKHIQNTYNKEIIEYDYLNPEREVKRFKIHAHATQIIWASTTEMGCAIARCNRKGIGFDVIYCNYHKHGNHTKPEQYKRNVLPPKATC
ncbi:MAG: CAP domain-containing protein [Pseudomonadota bacterium]